MQPGQLALGTRPKPDDLPQSVTMFLWPCEIDLRTLISLRICSKVRVSKSTCPCDYVKVDVE